MVKLLTWYNSAANVLDAFANCWSTFVGDAIITFERVKARTQTDENTAGMNGFIETTRLCISSCCDGVRVTQSERMFFLSLCALWYESHMFATFQTQKKVFQLQVPSFLCCFVLSPTSHADYSNELINVYCLHTFYQTLAQFDKFVCLMSLISIVCLSAKRKCKQKQFTNSPKFSGFNGEFQLNLLCLFHTC